VDAKLDAKAITTRLASRGLTASDVEERAWPRTATAYLATVRRAADSIDPAKAAAVRAARAPIESIDNVLAAIEQRGETWLVFTKEPCTNLEERLRAALKPAGFELAEVHAR